MEQSERMDKMMEFLVLNLKRPVTGPEVQFITWLACYENATYDQVMALFEELVSNSNTKK